MVGQRRNLVITPAGDESRHESWLREKSARQFDLALVYFGNRPGRYVADADYYLERRGFKFHLIDAMLNQLGPRLDPYDMIWCPDDDIVANTHDVNRLFAIARQHGLSIAQPAIATGDVSFESLRQQPGLLLRYTRFVEVMCPLFSRAALDVVRHTFLENKSAWGLDWAWTTLVPAEQMAVIDAVAVHHTRPLQSGAGYQRMREQGVDPLRDLAQMIARYGGVSCSRQRQVLRGTLRVPAIALDGSRRWVGPAWWNRWLASLKWRRKQRRRWQCRKG